MFTVVDITNTPKKWDEFVSTMKFQPFTQSSIYLDFYDSLGEKGSIIGIFDGAKIVGGSIVVTTHAKRGNFIFLPYGPFIGDETIEYEMLQALRDYLIRFAKSHKYDFIRISPFLNFTESRLNIWNSLGFVRAPIHMLAEDTWLLDLNKNNDELLAQMNKNHRNLIRRLDRDGAHITMSENPNDLNDLHDLLDITAKRHKFHRFSRQYINSEFEAFSKNNNAVLFRSYLPDGRLDGAAVIIYYGNMAAYRHSGSLNLDSRYPTSYLLQWHAIQEAKRRGIEWYNFWGIAPEKSKKKHPFFGITHFKKGFGGENKQLLSCQDFRINKTRYLLVKTIETLRRIRRGF